MRIGVLSGGGDCPGINAVIRAVVRSARNAYGHQCLGIRDGFEGLMDPPNVVALGNREIAGALTRGGTLLGASNRVNPFAFAVAGGREDRSAEVARNIKALGIDGLIVIGGDGTLLIAKKLFENYGVPLVGVPKTIDNDLSATGVTFGFDTAVATATDAIDKLQTTAESHHRVMYLEVMGRHAGWIALTAGIAGGAHVILIPEIPFSIEQICAKIRQREEEGDRYTIAVVAEGAKEAGGEEIYAEKSPRFGAPRLGGVAEQVARKVFACNEREYRVTVLGHVQRGGVPTAHDRVLSTRFGVRAVQALSEGEAGKMVALIGNKLLLVPLAEAVGKQKLVDPEGELVATARAMGVSFGDRPPLGGKGN
jgi:6-phosphofructokinase 1